MDNKSITDSLTRKYYEENIVDLVKKFLEYTDDLLRRGVISEELYHELRQKKVKFLKNVEERES